VYDAYEGQYYPDYTLTPLSLVPQISVIDRDGIINNGVVNDSLYDIVWTIESTDSSKNGTITSGVGGYEVENSGKKKGTLYVKTNNLDSGERITYNFSAKYKDSRTSQIIRVQDSFLVQCLTASEAVPELTLDKDVVSPYNPLRDETADITISAQLYLGDKGVVSDNDVKYIWLVRYEDATPQQTQTLGVDKRDQYVLELSSDGKSVTVHRDRMGDILALRCVARFKIGTSPENVSYSDDLPTKTVFLRRDLGDYNITIMDCPTRVQPDALTIPMKVKVTDNQGVLDSNVVDEVFFFEWGLTTNGSLITKPLAYGQSVNISTDNMSSDSMFVAVTATDKGAFEYVTDESGDYFVDEDGEIIICN
jgi:hypothetical protein